MHFIAIFIYLIDGGVYHMHPNLYLRTLWRRQRRNEVFVVMSFDPKYQNRFENIIKPAIEDEPFNKLKLTAERVDNSKSGDSILTENKKSLKEVMTFEKSSISSDIHSNCRLMTSVRHQNYLGSF